MEEVQKKNKLTQWGSQILTSILTSDMKVIKIAQKYFLWIILRVFSDHHLWCQNWCQYLWTSLCQFIFFLNLLHSLGVWFFDIWHFFDNMTSFWQLDIFLIFWEQIAHGPHCPCVPYPCTPLPMYPIAHMAHTPCTLYPCAPIAHVPHTPVPNTPSGPHCPYAPYAQYPIAHVTHCPCGPYPLYPMPPVPHCP